MPRPRKPANPFRYFHSSPEVIRLVVLIHNHFSQERHLVDRQTYKLRRSAALAEWQSLAS